jgi:hypothetical protein
VEELLVEPMGFINQQLTESGAEPLSAREAARVAELHAVGKTIIKGGVDSLDSSCVPVRPSMPLP